MNTFSPELSFIPRKAPYYLLNEETRDLVLRINVELTKIAEEHKYKMIAKTDVQGGQTRKHESTFCIEVTPATRFDWNSFHQNGTLWKSLEKIFQMMDKQFGLVPRVVKQRNGVEKHMPSGGLHIHCGSDIFWRNYLWYDQMKTFHMNLVTDHENRPYVRWLFSEWFNDISCTTFLAQNLNRKLDAKRLFKLKHCLTDIRPRFMQSGKSAYATFELRFFNMVENVEELYHVVEFCGCWLNRIKKSVNDNEQIEVDLTRDKLTDMSDLRKSRKICRNYIDSLGLKWKDYEVFYNRNYRNRILYGKML